MAPSREPQSVIADKVWYYENPRSLEFHTDVRDVNGNHLQHVCFTVPLRKLVTSIKRIRQPRRPKARS